ncbi:MAG: hypothetical protein M3Z26_01960 [Bacteroidota bacterium]|nr:hypothetical protein [Bacteroidota bacterium]
MSLEEFEDAPDTKTKRYIMMRSITDFGMGFIYISVGLIIFFGKEFNFSTDFTRSILAKLFAVLALIYGSWRIYRGIKKNYFREL